MRNFNKYKSFSSPLSSKCLVFEQAAVCGPSSAFCSHPLLPSLFALEAVRERDGKHARLPHNIPFKIQRKEGTRYGGNVIIRPKCKTLFLRHTLATSLFGRRQSAAVSPYTLTHTHTARRGPTSSEAAAGVRAAISRRLPDSRADPATVRQLPTHHTPSLTSRLPVTCRGEGEGKKIHRKKRSQC